jgi:hypothetical protein
MFRARVMRHTASVTSTTVPGSFLILSQIDRVSGASLCSLRFLFPNFVSVCFVEASETCALYVVVISRPLCLNPRIEAESFGLRLCLKSCICSKVLLPCWLTLNSVGAYFTSGSGMKKKYGSGSGDPDRTFQIIVSNSFLG